MTQQTEIEKIREEVLEELNLGDFHKELPTEYFKDISKAISLAIQKTIEFKDKEKEEMRQGFLINLKMKDSVSFSDSNCNWSFVVKNFDGKGDYCHQD